MGLFEIPDGEIKSRNAATAVRAAAATPAVPQNSSFIVTEEKESPPLLPEERALMDSIAAKLQGDLPIMREHKVFGAVANRLTLRRVAGQPAKLVEIWLGPTCGGGGCGEVKQILTVRAIAKSLTNHAAVQNRQVRFIIRGMKGENLDSGPTG